MNSINIKLVKSAKELKQIFKIREIVFIKEQRVSKNIERDEFDKVAKHVIVLYKNNPIGCARIRFIDNKAKINY